MTCCCKKSPARSPFVKDRQLAAMTLQVRAIVEGSVLQRAGMAKEFPLL